MLFLSSTIHEDIINETKHSVQTIQQSAHTSLKQLRGAGDPERHLVELVSAKECHKCREWATLRG